MQYNINVANGTGMEVRTNLNLAHQSLATNFFGATDPSLMSPVCAFPGSTWADTGNGLLKVRKADNSDWIVIGTIESDGTPKITSNGFTVNASDVVNTPSGTISATDVQSALNSLNVLPLLLRSTIYAVDDVAFCIGLPSLTYLSCTTGGTTDSSAIVIPSPVDVGDTITDGTVTWTVKKVGESDLTEYTKTVNSPMFNKRDVVTTSGTYTAPVTGWYKITAKGGGGGGAGAYIGSPNTEGGGGGGEGGTTIAYEKLTAGDSVSVVIGAGGAGGANGPTYTVGSDGGNSTVTVNSNTYTGGGGTGGGNQTSAGPGGVGGEGTIKGASGGSGSHSSIGGAGYYTAGVGGGNGGANYTRAASQGGGGVGGYAVHNSSAGGDGYVWFEYFATI